jgi:hypothetical protein
VRGKREVLAWFELIADRRPFFNRVGYGADVPGQTFTANAPTTASPANVWARLQVPATWEGISGVDRPGPREHEVSLTWDIATSEIKGWVRVDLQPLNAGTRVEVTMHVESISMMASFGFPFIASAIANGFQQTVEHFAAGMSED